MTTSINGIAVDIHAPVQTARASAPVVSTTGVNDPAAIARQQLPSAVPAPALLAAYSTKIPQPPKQAQRNATPQPSSTLAAQFIAQDDSLQANDLAIFTPRAIPEDDTPPPIADRYLPTANTTEETSQLSGADSIASHQQVLAAAVDEVASHAEAAALGNSKNVEQVGSSQLAAVLPSIFEKFLRRQSIAQVRGVEAYQLASTRNAVTRAQSTIAPSNL